MSKHLLSISADYKPSSAASTSTIRGLFGSYIGWNTEESSYSVSMRLSARALGTCYKHSCLMKTNQVLGTFILSQLLYPADPALKARATAIRKNPHDVMPQESNLQTEIGNLLALKKLTAYHVSLPILDSFYFLALVNSSLGSCKSCTKHRRLYHRTRQDLE